MRGKEPGPFHLFSSPDATNELLVWTTSVWQPPVSSRPYPRLLEGRRYGDATYLKTGKKKCAVVNRVLVLVKSFNFKIDLNWNTLEISSNPRYSCSKSQKLTAYKQMT